MRCLINGWISFIILREGFIKKFPANDNVACKFVTFTAKIDKIT